MTADLSLDDLAPCFNGLVPAVITTCSARGVPNVTYVSRAHPVDAGHIAISNQFLSKSSRNLAEHPFASIIVVRPETMAEYRLSVEYERTERRGPVFDRLRNDLSMIAALTGMQEVFHLTAADIYRVVTIDEIENVGGELDPTTEAAAAPGHAALGELSARLSRCADLDALVRITVEGLADLLGYEHSNLMLLDEAGTRLFTIASHGYVAGGIGAELAVGDGVAGRAAAQCAPQIVGNVSQMTKYSRTVRRSFEEGGVGPVREVPMVGLERPGSQLAVPALALGQLVGVLVVEDARAERFTRDDAVVLSIVTSIVAGTIETLRNEVRTSGVVAARAEPVAPGSAWPPVVVRHYVVDGSTFLDGDYLIKGVAGKLLWSLLRHHEVDSRTEFTNREMRLDPTLELPDFRDNFESRLILLKRRLDERAAPIRIEKTGRGRFRLVVSAAPRLELVGDD